MVDFRALALIPLAPLLGAVYCGLLGSRMQARFGKAAVHIPAVAMPALSFAVTVAAFLKLIALPADQRTLFCHLWNWLPVGGLGANLDFIMDPLTLVMCFVVAFVGTLIHLYSIGYMRDEPGYWRFFSYLNLFMFSMLVLVLGDNFALMFVGWEGVGLCSYLLIGFWYQEPKNAVAGMKAFVVNRIGDFGFVLGLLLLFWGMQGDWSRDRFTPQAAAPAAAVSAPSHEPPAAAQATGLTFRGIREKLAEPAFRAAFVRKKVFGISLVALIGTLLFVGAMGKSAQLPLYVWLPDAMAGPTPVSALIHAATMVTAGVYMVARLNFIFALSPFVMTWIAVIGVLTALFAATIGFFQHDIKKVLAYSTVSQLGFMFIAVGVGAYGVGIFHLMTHAFFKACLFLGAGSVIVGCHHEQDMRKMGGLKKLMPVTAATYFIACCAIAGFPLTSGFFSKDEILWKAFNAGNLILPGGGIAIWVLGALTALGTSFYMFRSYYMTFSGEYRGAGGAHHHEPGAHASRLHHAPKESPASMTYVLVALAALSLIGGLAGLPHLWHLPNYLHHWLDPVFEGTAGLIHGAGHGASAEWALMAVSIALALTGWRLARWLYLDNKNPIPQELCETRTAWVRGIHTLVCNKYYVDEIYNATVIRAVMSLRLALDWFDRTVVDGLVNVTRPIILALAWLHGEADRRAVDGAVNGTASMITGAGGALRLLQTGNIRTYLYVAMAGGIILILAGYVLF